MLVKLITSSSKSYFRLNKRKSLKLFVFIVFFTTFLLVANVHLRQQVFAQEVTRTNEKEDDKQKILTEIRIAKNFIENTEWEKARTKLVSIIKTFPQNHHLDIAYYWLANTLFQQKKIFEAEQIIIILQSEFPSSAWIDESKSLLVEINSKNGQKTVLTNEEFSRSNDETKAFVVQNLLETDRTKAVSIIDEILSPAGNAADNLKEAVLIILFDDKSDWATEKFTQIIKTNSNENLLKKALIGLGGRDEKKILPFLRNFLQQNTNENLFDAALYSVSRFSETSATAVLVYLAKNGRHKELKQKSIIWLGNIGSKNAIEELKSLYKLFTELEFKQQVQISLSEINTPESLKSLIGLIEVETNNNLIEYGLEILKQKINPTAIKHLEKKLKIKN